MVRRTGDILTGGTKDVNPQYISGIVTQTGADTTTTAQFTLPVEKFGSSGTGKARIIEILKVFVTMDGLAEVDSEIDIAFSTVSFGTTTVAPNDPRIFAFWHEITKITTSGQLAVIQPWVFDLTDGAGHGWLCATDSFFVQLASVTTSLTNVLRFKILYRFKGVGLAEYIGIVQGQQ